MRPYAQFTWSRPIRRPNGVCTSTSSSPHGAQLLHFSMCCAQWRQQQPDANALFRKLDQAWQGASPLQRRLAVATATTLRRPPHPLRRTGAAQHHLSPMRASSAKRDNAGGERARARRKAAWCRCRKANPEAPPAWLLASWSVATVAAFPLRAPSPKCFECEASGRDARGCDATAWVRRANGWTKKCVSLATKISP